MGIYTLGQAPSLQELVRRAREGENVVIEEGGRLIAELRPLAHAASKGITQADIDWLEANAIKPLKPFAQDAGALVSSMRDEEWGR